MVFFIWQNGCQKTVDGPEPTLWFLGGCHWAQFGLVARSINLKRALTTSDAKWPHCVMVNLCILCSKICIHESYTDGRPFDMTYIYETPDSLPIKTSNILHKHTRTYHYKRWVLSQAHSFIDPCKMAESTVNVVAQWDCKVNINQRERWLIDPLLPNSPSLLRLTMPSFNAPPSLSLHCKYNQIGSRRTTDCSSHLTCECISDHVHSKPAKSEGTSSSFFTWFWPSSHTKPLTKM